MPGFVVGGDASTIIVGAKDEVSETSGNGFEALLRVEEACGKFDVRHRGNVLMIND